MIASMIRENPGLALLGVLLILCTILLFPIIAAVRRRSNEEERRRSDRSARPLRRGGYEYDEYVEPRHIEAKQRAFEPRGSGRRRHPPVRGARLGSLGGFLLGILVGASGAALWFNPPDPELAGVIGSTDSTIGQVVDAPPQVKPKESDRLTAATPAREAPSETNETSIDAKLDNYVVALRRQLPLAVGPGISMVDARVENRIVTLAFTISQVVADDDMAKVQATLETRFRTGVCGGPQSEDIRILNQEGASFLLIYVDLVGKTVAKLVLPPGFCVSSQVP